MAQRAPMASLPGRGGGHTRPIVVATLTLLLAGGLSTSGVSAQGRDRSAPIKAEFGYQRKTGGRNCAPRFDLPALFARHPRLGAHSRLTFREAQQNKLVRAGTVRVYIDESGQYQEVTLFAAGDDPDTIVAWAVYGLNGQLPNDRKLTRIIRSLDAEELTELMNSPANRRAITQWLDWFAARRGACLYSIDVRMPRKQEARAIEALGLLVPVSEEGPVGDLLSTCMAEAPPDGFAIGGRTLDIVVREVDEESRTPLAWFSPDAEPDPFSATYRLGGSSVVVEPFEPDDRGTIGIAVSGSGLRTVEVRATDRSTGQTWVRVLRASHLDGSLVYEDRAAFPSDSPEAALLVGGRELHVSVRFAGLEGDPESGEWLEPGDIEAGNIVFTRDGSVVDVTLTESTNPAGESDISVSILGSEVDRAEVTVTDPVTGETWVRVVESDTPTGDLASEDRLGFGAIEIETSACPFADMPVTDAHGPSESVGVPDLEPPDLESLAAMRMFLERTFAEIDPSAPSRVGLGPEEGSVFAAIDDRHDAVDCGTSIPTDLGDVSYTVLVVGDSVTSLVVADEDPIDAAEIELKVAGRTLTMHWAGAIEGGNDLIEDITYDGLDSIVIDAADDPSPGGLPLSVTGRTVTLRWLLADRSADASLDPEAMAATWRPALDGSVDTVELTMRTSDGTTEACDTVVMRRVP